MLDYRGSEEEGGMMLLHDVISSSREETMRKKKREELYGSTTTFLFLPPYLIKPGDFVVMMVRRSKGERERGKCYESSRAWCLVVRGEKRGGV